MPVAKLLFGAALSAKALAGKSTLTDCSNRPLVNKTKCERRGPVEPYLIQRQQQTSGTVKFQQHCWPASKVPVVVPFVFVQEFTGVNPPPPALVYHQHKQSLSCSIFPAGCTPQTRWLVRPESSAAGVSNPSSGRPTQKRSPVNSGGRDRCRAQQQFESFSLWFPLGLNHTKLHFDFGFFLLSSCLTRLQ